MNPWKPKDKASKGFLQGEGLPLFFLLFTFLLFFKDWRHPFTHVFLSLDTSVLYYPVYHWVHDHIPQDKLPLICDLSMHGAPVAAVSMAGVMSPVLWLFHFIPSFTLLFNVLFLLPHFLYLFGAYFLGRRLKLSRSASILLAVIWTYNGHQMAQLDHLNVAWAHAFFPWAFNALLKYLETRRVFWLLTASLFLGLNVLSGHPQVVLLESLFFLFWALLSDKSQWRQKLTAVVLMGLGGLVVASPLILFTGECLNGNSHLQWGEVDRFFHSWTPFNFITLVFPWFFGKDQFDRAGVDYWWQYQFVEMQVAFSITALFFILLFFLQKGPQRRWIVWTALFAVLMAFGKFFFLYSPVQSLPIFNFFRDPARYWFLATWVLGLGAAYSWEAWFKDGNLILPGRKLALTLGGLVGGFLLLGWFLVTVGRPVMMDLGQSFIRHFLMGDSLHTQPLTAYLQRLPEKLNSVASNLDIRRGRIWLPVLLTIGLVVTVFNRKKWNLSHQKYIFLVLVLMDLYAFRMPLGHAFYDPTTIPGPQYPAPQNRSLTLLSQNVSPLPKQYGEMAYPNWNLISGRPNLVFDANPMLAGYSELYAKLGWFSWVYKDRDPMGFANNIEALRVLGIDQIISDTSLNLPKPFKTILEKYPFTYQLQNCQSRAYLVTEVKISPKPDYNFFEQPEINDAGIVDHRFSLNSSLVELQISETRDFLKFDYLIFKEFPNLNSHNIFSSGTQNPKAPPAIPEIANWQETNLTVLSNCPLPTFLILQKTFLPAWKALLDGKPTETLKCNLVLTGIFLHPGKNKVELQFNPTGLRLGFFLLFLFFGLFSFHFLRRLVA